MAKQRTAGERLSVSIGCPKCHGQKGISKKAGVPHIAGQRKGYLLNQLRAFRKGHIISTNPYGQALRSEQAMKKPVKLLTPENELDIATYYASLTCFGSKKNGVPAPERSDAAEVCTACHGEDGNSLSEFIPRLAGQKADYLAGELRAFRMTKGDPRSFRFRNRRFHQYMSAIAAPLTNEQIRSIANWFSSRPCSTGQGGK